MANLAGMKDCAEALAKTRGITKSEAESIMKDVVEVIASKCVDGGVSFKGVFTIKPKVQKGRTGTTKFKGVEKQWKTEDKVVLAISTGSDMEAELNK